MIAGTRGEEQLFVIPSFSARYVTHFIRCEHSQVYVSLQSVKTFLAILKNQEEPFGEEETGGTV